MLSFTEPKDPRLPRNRYIHFSLASVLFGPAGCLFWFDALLACLSPPSPPSIDGPRWLEGAAVRTGM